VLAFFSQLTETTIIVGEGTGRGNAYNGFKNYGYFDLIRRYNVGFMDLNHDETVEVRVLDSNFDPVPVRISKTIAESDLRISVCPPKTHDEVLYTGVLKNMVSGAFLKTWYRDRWCASRDGYLKYCSNGSPDGAGSAVMIR
jgi:uncharacterized protein (DUF362 family)